MRAFDASTISLPSSRASDSIAAVIHLTPNSVAEESRKETTAVIPTTADSDSLPHRAQRRRWHQMGQGTELLSRGGDGTSFPFPKPVGREDAVGLIS